MAIQEVDWELLKQEYITNVDYPQVRAFLAKFKKWEIEKIVSGNTNEHIAGWSKERAIYQQRIFEESMAETIAIQRRRIPSILAAKLNLVSRAIADLELWEELSSREKRLIYYIIKTELGECVTIHQSQLKIPDDAIIDEGINELRKVIGRSRSASEAAY